MEHVGSLLKLFAIYTRIRIGIYNIYNVYPMQTDIVNRNIVFILKCVLLFIDYTVRTRLSSTALSWTDWPI